MNDYPDCRLYAITPPNFVLSEFVPKLEEAFSAGDIACLQLRLKGAPKEEIIAVAEALMPICHANDAAFIVNDDIAVALQIGADGVHVGQEDLAGTSVKEVREKLTDGMVLGITCHASSHLAMEAGEQGADYVAFGAFYETTSKPKEKLEKWGVPTLELLQNWTEFSMIQSVAIGGVTPDNCAPLVQSGADFIAVITGIWDNPQGVSAGVKAYNKAIQEALADKASA